MSALRARVLAFLLVACAATSFSGTTTVAHAGTAADDVTWLNAKRAAHGIPAGIRLHAQWSSACARHVGYMRTTSTVTHGEDRALSSFSEDGDWAGRHAVLASGARWTATHFIWEGAPLHLAQLLAPQLQRVGVADDNAFVCMTTWPGYTRAAPAAVRVVTYPGNGASIYPSISTDEWPTTPAEALGLPNPTGPHLYAYAWGAGLAARDATVRSASVRGPDGPVAVRWVDRTDPKVGAYLPASAAIIIPVRPLRRDADYLATVTFSSGIRHVWSFTTRAGRRTDALRNVRVLAETSPDGRSVVRVCGQVRSAGSRPIVVHVGATTARTVARPGSGRFTVRVDVGRQARRDAIVRVEAAGTTGAYAVRLRR